MDTSRIGQFLGWASKATAATDAPNAQSGGFADLLFGVMSRRQQPQLMPAKVSTVLPIGEAGPATQRLAPERAHQGARAAGEAVAASSDTQANGAKSAAAKSPAEAPANKPAPAMDDKPGIEDVTELAPAGESIETEADNGEEIDLKPETGGAADGDSGDDAGQPGDQPPEQQIVAAAIEPQVVAATPIATPVVETETQPVANAVAANDTAGAAQPDVAADDISLAATLTTGVPLIGEKKPQEAAGALPQAETDTPAEAATKVVNQATEATLSMVGETLATEADAAAGVAMRQSDRRGEDQAGQFRRAAQPARQRPDTASTGTAGTAAQPAAAALSRGAIPAGIVTNSASTAGLSSTVQPLNLEGGFGAGTGMPGWNLNLMQGAANRRPEFLANLRQHLQNLPTHDQVALGIQRAARDGGGSISMQLSPTELGRIHVKLDIDDEKNVRASVSVERPATLDLLQRDVKALERALQDAGLKMDQGDLSFSLHRGGEESLAGEFSGNGQGSGPFEAGTADEDLPAEINQPAIIATGDGFVDVQI